MHATITGYMRETETLTARVAELEAALRDCIELLDDPDNPAMYGFEHVVKVARAALAKGQA